MPPCVTFPWGVAPPPPRDDEMTMTKFGRPIFTTFDPRKEVILAPTTDIFTFSTFR